MADSSAGPLQPLLDTPGVTDVLVNGPGDAWLDRGRGLEQVGRGAVTQALATPGAVRDLAVRLAGLAGRRLDDASPLVDARLPDGTRLHAALPPVSGAHPLISLRVVRQQALTLADIAASSGLPSRMRQALEMLVQARASVVITGATGSGKTTLLASLLSLVPADERIVVIEEAGEVMPDHPHVVRLVERRPNVEGAGAVSLATLVREALRMRPDRVVLGECRGAEVREVLAAFNTGHRGGFMTLHANGPQDVPARFTSLSALAGLDERSALVHAGTAFDAVVHMERRDGRRVVAAIAAVKGGGGMTVLPALALAPDGTVVEGPGIGALEALCAA